MSTTVHEYDSTRSITIEGGGDQPDSQWIFVETFLDDHTPQRFYALDRTEFIRAVCAELGLVDPLEQLLTL